MIEDRIKILRRAATVSSRENKEHVWCIIAGNEKLVDDIAYNAITAKDRVQILFRESIKITEKYTAKRYDCIMLKGETLKISELRNRCEEQGGTSSFIKTEFNTKVKLPSFLKSTVTPLLDMSDVVLSIILVSVIDEDDIEKVKVISQSNSLFGIDLKMTIQDKEMRRIQEQKLEEEKIATQQQELEEESEEISASEQEIPPKDKLKSPQ